MRITKIEESMITFDNGSTITYDHRQDCCEHVYADFVGSLSDTDIMNFDFDEINIEKVPDSGFRLNGYFIACYNIQNGYYSSDLQLIITKITTKITTIDLTSCTSGDEE